MGYTHIDTAAFYENEGFIGGLLCDMCYLDSNTFSMKNRDLKDLLKLNGENAKRQQLYITTKIPPNFLGREKVRLFVIRGTYECG